MELKHFHGRAGLADMMLSAAPHSKKLEFYKSLIDDIFSIGSTERKHVNNIHEDPTFTYKWTLLSLWYHRVSFNQATFQLPKK